MFNSEDSAAMRPHHRFGIGQAPIGRPTPLTDVDAIGFENKAGLLLLDSRPVLPPDLPIEDWNISFCAVMQRLKLVAGERWDESQEPAAEALRRVQTSLSECVEALELLCPTHQHELGRMQQQDLEAVDLNTWREHAAITEATAGKYGCFTRLDSNPVKP